MLFCLDIKFTKKVLLIFIEQIYIIYIICFLVFHFSGQIIFKHAYALMYQLQSIMKTPLLSYQNYNSLLQLYMLGHWRVLGYVLESTCSIITNKNATAYNYPHKNSDKITHDVNCTVITLLSSKIFSFEIFHVLSGIGLL